MAGARRGLPEDGSSGKELWTPEGIESLLRKLRFDPGLADDFKRFAEEAVRNSAIKKGIILPDMPNDDKVSSRMNFHDFDNYQDFTDTVAIYPTDVSLSYTVSGLCGEAGEVAGKVQKVVERTIAADKDDDEERRENLRHFNSLLLRFSAAAAELEKFKKSVRNRELEISVLLPLTETETTEISKELGDTGWYIPQTAKALGLKYSSVVKGNVDKLTSRKDRGVLHGSGDNR